jgi:hypothetical protein
VLVGDTMVGADGQATVVSVATYDASLRVYNFSVEGTHTYAVSASGLLVHNKSATEEHVVDALGGNASEVRFTEAMRPRNQPPPFREVPVCRNCEARYGRDPFPPGTKFQADGN